LATAGETWVSESLVEGPDGCKPFFCYLDNLKVDAPIALAKFITDMKNTSNIGKADKTLLQDHSKFIHLARSLEERTGIVGKLSFGLGLAAIQ
jgi:hypothetical protein